MTFFIQDCDLKHHRIGIIVHRFFANYYNLNNNTILIINLKTEHDIIRNAY